MGLKGVGARLKELRKEARLSQEELAKQLELSQSQLSSLEHDRINLSFNALIKICQYFDVSTEWFLYGKGSSLKKSESAGLIPLIDEKAEAGYLSHHTDRDFVQNLSSYKIPGCTADKEFRIFEVRNDHMYPSLQLGDLVICQKTELGVFKNGSLTALVTENNLMICRVYQDTAQASGYIAVSDNPRYRDQKVPNSSIREIWMVKSKITNSFLPTTNQEERIAKLEAEVDKIKDQVN